MAVTATSPMAVILDGLRNLVANSSTFQTAVDAANHTNAKDFIYLVEAPTPKYRPCAIVSVPGAGVTYTPKVTGLPSYTGLIRLEYITPVDLSHDEQMFSVYNFFDGVAQDLAVLIDHRRGATNDATLRPTRIVFGEDIMRSRITHHEDIWITSLVAAYDNT